MFHSRHRRSLVRWRLCTTAIVFLHFHCLSVLLPARAAPPFRSTEEEDTPGGWQKSGPDTTTHPRVEGMVLLTKEVPQRGSGPAADDGWEALTPNSGSDHRWLGVAGRSPGGVATINDVDHNETNGAFWTDEKSREGMAEARRVAALRGSAEQHTRINDVNTRGISSATAAVMKSEGGKLVAGFAVHEAGDNDENDGGFGTSNNAKGCNEKAPSLKHLQHYSNRDVLRGVGVDDVDQLAERRRLLGRQELQPRRRESTNLTQPQRNGKQLQTSWAESGPDASGYRSDVVPFLLGGKTAAFMPGDGMRDYLNSLVDKSIAAVENQTSNIAFVKTHKTASTTMATILYRYGKRHGIKVAHFARHHSTIDIEEAANQVRKSGERLDLMHYHHSWDGFYAGTWETAARAYKSIMRDTSNINLVTVLREPVSHYLSYYYYYMQPLAELSIEEYLELAMRPKRALSPPIKRILSWHGEGVLHNPLCAEFGIRSLEQLNDFVENDLPQFAMILITEFFEQSLAIFMRMFDWDPIDMTFCRMIETKSGHTRYDGKVLVDVPKPSDLSPEVMAKIKELTALDLILYKAAVSQYHKLKRQYGQHLDIDVDRIRETQSAVHGYLGFDPKSNAHAWYEGNVKIFDHQVSVRNF